MVMAATSSGRSRAPRAAPSLRRCRHAWPAAREGLVLSSVTRHTCPSAASTCGNPRRPRTAAGNRSLPEGRVEPGEAGGRKIAARSPPGIEPSAAAAGAPSVCACLVPLAWPSCIPKAARVRAASKPAAAPARPPRRTRPRSPAGRTASPAAPSDRGCSATSTPATTAVVSHLPRHSRRSSASASSTGSSVAIACRTAPWCRLVVFLAVDLEGVLRRRGARCQTCARAPYGNAVPCPQPRAVASSGAASGTLPPAMPTPSVSRMKTLAFATASGGMSEKRSPAAWAARRWAARAGSCRHDAGAGRKLLSRPGLARGACGWIRCGGGGASAVHGFSKRSRRRCPAVGFGSTPAMSGRTC